MLFRFRAMSCHIVVVGGAGIFHFVDGFFYVVVDGFQIVPVASLPHSDSCSKRETHRKNRNCNRFLHIFPFKMWISFFPRMYVAILPSHGPTVKQNPAHPSDNHGTWST